VMSGASGAMVILLRMLAVGVACQRRGVVSFTRVAASTGTGQSSWASEDERSW
jgi:hypothetical protein